MTTDINQEIRMVTEQIEQTTRRMEQITCRAEVPDVKSLRKVKTQLNILTTATIVLSFCLIVGIGFCEKMYSDWRFDQQRLHEITEVVQKQNRELIELHQRIR